MKCFFICESITKDQYIMFEFTTNKIKYYMPLPILLANKLACKCEIQV